MSTTFSAIKRQYLQDKKVVKALKEWVKNDDTNAFNEEILKDDMFVEVAFRGNFSGAYLFEAGEILPDNVKIYPLDNSFQGIYTIGDVRKEEKGEE
ncbi:hypothetical protein AGMMS50262_00390 [Bacteroidia bacterium]|nr:hypothetical protein AGMMS50262_00390 [Bacteroidia bacterium]